MNQTGFRLKNVLVICILVTATIAISGACKKEKTASISGRIINTLPPGQDMIGVEIAAISNGQEFGSGKVDPKTGEYTIAPLKPGIYDLKLKTPVGVLVYAYNIEAKAGEIVKASDIDLPPDAFPPTPTPQTTSNQPPETSSISVPPEPTIATQETRPSVPGVKGTASIKGTVYPPDAMVAVVAGGKVVAQTKATGGKFAVPNVQPGLYNVEFSAPGFASEEAENVAVSSQGVTNPLNGFLLYKSPLDGVDYNKGVVTATGLGKATPNMPPAQSSIMACRAAKVVAYRNLLDMLLSLQVEKGKTIRSVDSGGKLTSELQGIMQGAHTIKEDKRQDGSCEVTLEINLYGPSGVTKFIQKSIGK